jgi:hypothetical protein
MAQSQKLKGLWALAYLQTVLISLQRIVFPFLWASITEILFACIPPIGRHCSPFSLHSTREALHRWPIHALVLTPVTCCQVEHPQALTGPDSFSSLSTPTHIPFFFPVLATPVRNLESFWTSLT